MAQSLPKIDARSLVSTGKSAAADAVVVLTWAALAAAGGDIQGPFDKSMTLN